MNLQQIEPYKIFEVVAGSHAYGTSTPESDRDLRGIFVMPPEHFLSLHNPVQQVSDEKNDITFYELRRYFELAMKCNPNIIELLWTPEDCIVLADPVAQHLIANRDIFVSKRAYHTFSGYAYAQIKRAKGQNKWVNNPQPEEPPSKLDFCWFIHANRYPIKFIPSVRAEVNRMIEDGIFPFRPEPVKTALHSHGCTIADLLPRCHVASLEHMENTYRLYHYGGDAKGVFRGPYEQLAVESIPKDDEWDKIIGLLIYNEAAYNKARNDWKHYWTWRKERNEARYRDQEAGEIEYDAKNMQHCMRLLWSGGNILKTGEPIVRFEGDKLQVLRDIRAGKYEYEHLMKMVEEEMEKLNEVKKQSDLRDSINMKHAEKLYHELVGLCFGGRQT